MSDKNNIQEFTQKIVNEEAEECLKYGIDPGDIFKAIVRAYDEKNTKTSDFVPFPEYIGKRSTKFGD
jgi:hypothetical protein